VLARCRTWPIGNLVKWANKQNSRCGEQAHPSPRQVGRTKVKILCAVNQAECLRHGVDAPSSTVKIEVDPKSLTQEQRDFVADELYDGLRFPSHERYQICPPNYDGLIAAIDYGLERKACLKNSYDKDTEELEKARKGFIAGAVQSTREAELAREKQNVEGAIPF
jgi:hypothetical protein